jgi:hypothetical protein
LDTLRYDFCGDWARSAPGRGRAICLWLIAMTALIVPVRAFAAEEAEVMAQLKNLRGIQSTSDNQELDRLNKLMDTAWQYLRENRTESVPIVIRELRNELKQQTPDQYFMLDTALFLILADDPKEDAQAREDLAIDVLKHIDPKASIIQANVLQLVRLTHALAKRNDPRVLPQIDRIFLEVDQGVEYFQAPHYVKLPAQSVRVLLYGATGPTAEDHLAKRLTDPAYEKYQRTFLALLVELGSERSVDAVKLVLNSKGDYERFSMAVTMLMRVGGPQGRDAVVNLKTDHLDARSLESHQRILAKVQKVTFEGLAQTVKEFDSTDVVFDDAELSKRLELYAESGMDREINPSNVLNSGIRKDELLDQLKRVRSRTLWRLNQHALEDLYITNQVINAIQFRP